jgi:Ca2+-transporting ATPase
VLPCPEPASAVIVEGGPWDRHDRAAPRGREGTTVTITEVGTPAGLTAAQATQRLRAEGPNEVPAARPRRLAGRLGHQLADPLVVVLLAAGVVTTLLGDLTDTAVIALVVVVNTAIGVTQEIRADRAIAALDRLAAPTARVVRDGADLVVPATELVRGDLVRMEAGDIVPADLTLRDAHRLQLDESALTGESVPVGRAAGEDAAAGTVVVTGRAEGTVARTGADSALGRIAAMVAAARPGPTPLQRRLAGLGRFLGIAAVGLSALVAVLGLLAGRPVAEMAVTAVSLVVAAVPESLPAVVTLALALGARRMARHRAIPRRLHAVETLGSVTVVAADKTGTLTEGRMSVQRVVTADLAEYTVEGVGYEPTGSLRGPADPAAVRELARAVLLGSDAAITPPTPEDPRWRAVGDPMEAALVAFAGRCGLAAETERAGWPRVAEQPFDQATRRMTTVHRRPDGRFLTVCKGGPEAVLTDPATAELRLAADRLAADGLRVIAVTTAVTASAPADPATPPPGLRPVGLVGIGDPIRGQAPAIADSFATAGIRLVLITGDHPATASAIAGRLGIWRDGEPVGHGESGAGSGSDAARVFARVQPGQKLDIVAALQQRGEVVAMTGDGVNDAPALRQADIGVAMGGGTEVARQAADLVLVDDNLATAAAAVAEGRRIYDNIRRFLRYGLAGGLAEILVMLVGPFLGLGVPLLPAQILWINLLTHGVPGVALGAEPAEPGLMRRPPRSPQDSILGGGLLRAVLVGAALIATVSLGAGVVAHQLGRPWQSMVFVVLGLAQLGVALAVRAPRRRGGPGNRALPVAVAVSAALQLAGVLLPPLRELLGTEPLSMLDLLGAAAVATLPGLGLVLARRFRFGLLGRLLGVAPDGAEPEHGRADQRRDHRADQDADLRVGLQHAAVRERQPGDEQRDREPDPGEHRQPGQHRPVDPGG